MTDGGDMSREDRKNCLPPEKLAEMAEELLARGNIGAAKRCCGNREQHGEQGKLFTQSMFSFRNAPIFYLPETGRVYTADSAADIRMPQNFTVFFLNRISTTIS